MSTSSPAAPTAAGPLRAAVESLIAGGVRHVVVCPGSRSTPMALALWAAPQLRTWVHLDERAGAFFALGAARASRSPVAVLATSGTAAVNFAPAVVEARYGRVPLLLMTADRPPELHAIGSPQTIDQVDLYGRHAKWFVDLPVPEDGPEIEAEVRGSVAHAVEVATTAPAGPVQLNMPFREPLLPDGPLSPGEVMVTPAPPRAALEPGALEAVRSALARSQRPLIVCGPIEATGFAPAAAALAARVGAVLLADVLANVRTGPHDGAAVVAHHDLLLRSERFRDEHRPDLVVRFGATPTSKTLTTWLDEIDGAQLVVDDGAGWDRPSGPDLLEADPVELLTALAGLAAGELPSADPGWLAAWRLADDAAAGALGTWFAGLDEPFEGGVARALEDALPDGAVVIVGNSMPVRDLDAFLPRSRSRLTVLSNRGANGIDGMVSTALGAASTTPGPVVAVLGDLSLLHDLGAIAAGGRLGIDATVVLVNNDGGGIFSFLPQAAADRPDIGLPAAYEELFGTPHGLDFGPVVRALGARHALVDQHSLGDELRRAVKRRGLDVLELGTDRRRNVTLHEEAVAAVEASLGSAPGSAAEPGA